MKKKLIAIVLTTLLTGGIGSTVVYNQHNDKVESIEMAQIDEDKDTSKNVDEGSSEESVESVVESNENIDDSVMKNSNEAVEIPVVGNANCTNEDKLSGEVNNVSTQADSGHKGSKGHKVTSQTTANNTVNSNVAVNNTAASTDSFMAQVEQLIYNKVNEERSKNGVSTLSYNTIMEKYARIKSQDMGDNNYFDHKDLNGNLITAKMQNDGVTYSAWGENIAYISGISDANVLAEKFMTNWMNSQGHRDNILSTNFNSIGIGVYKIGNKVYATQEFYR